MSPDPRGIVIGESFADYIAELRETWPVDEELRAKHVEPDGKGHADDLTMSKSKDAETDAQPQTTETPTEPNMGRRRYMQLVGATAVATVAASGSASAAGGGLAYGSDLTPNPFVSGTVEVADVVVSEGALSYTDNNGTDVSLEDVGGQLAEREDEETPHNPVTIRADRIDAADFTAFPRDETYTDADDEEQDLDAIDAQHWSTDESGTAGTITVEDMEPASGGDGLRISTSGQTSGDAALARFTDVSISSGELRRYLQLVLNIPTLESGAVVEVRVEDSTGSQTAAVIDSAADGTADATIATGTGSGIVYQSQLGDLASDMDGIEAIEISVAEANATVEIAGLNAERESAWTFGEREITNSDDEIETETIEEPSGEFSVTGLDTLGSTFDDATINPLTLDVELRASGVPDDHVDVVEADPGRFRFDARRKVAQNIPIPSAYDLSWSDLSVVGTVRHPSDRYNEVLSAVGLEDVQMVADIEDVSTTDRTTDFESGAIDDEITVESTPSPGDTVVVYHDLLLTSEEDNEITSPSAIGGMVGGSGGGGSWIETPAGIISAIGTGLVGYLGIVRGWFGSILGGS